MAWCRRALRRDPRDLGALEEMAHALWQGERYDEVIRVTTRLLRLNPYEPGYRYARGLAALARGDLGASVKDLRMALDQSDCPDFRDKVREVLSSVRAWQQGRGPSRLRVN